MTAQAGKRLRERLRPGLSRSDGEPAQAPPATGVRLFRERNIPLGAGPPRRHGRCEQPVRTGRKWVNPVGRPGPAALRGDIDANVSSTGRSGAPSLSHVAVVEEQEQMRDEELCAEIIRAALSLVTAKRPQDFLKAQLLLLQMSEELHILRS